MSSLQQPFTNVSYIGFQCISDKNQCVPVTSVTYDTNFPLYGSVRNCEIECGRMYSIGSYCGGDLDVDPGPKKAPKIFG